MDSKKQLPGRKQTGDISSRSRRVQSEQRKRQIIEATITCIDRNGLSQLTLDKVAAESGITKGNLVFHFRNRENLLEQTLQHLNEEYLESWQSAFAAAGDDPLRQLLALIDVRFSPTICSRKKISIWYAFWGETRSRPKYMKVCGESDQAFSNALLQCCHALHQQVGGSLDTKTSALAIEGMIDGLWQDILISPQRHKRADAATAVHRLVGALFPLERAD